LLSRASFRPRRLAINFLAAAPMAPILKTAAPAPVFGSCVGVVGVSGSSTGSSGFSQSSSLIVIVLSYGHTLQLGSSASIEGSRGHFSGSSLQFGSPASIVSSCGHTSHLGSSASILGSSGHFSGSSQALSPPSLAS